VKLLAERLVVEALRGGVERDEAAGAAMLAAWAMSGGQGGRSSKSM